MEGSEGASQGLYAGWSSLVHQPCEDLEESDLPSTVDIAAFSTGLSVDPANSSGQTLNADSDSDSEADSSNSGSEASHSGSQTDSSESDSSTSSQESTSRSSSPAEFSVTTSQTGGGLRLTIATVKKNCVSPPVPNEKLANPVVNNNDSPIKNAHNIDSNRNNDGRSPSSQQQQPIRNVVGSSGKANRNSSNSNVVSGHYSASEEEEEDNGREEDDKKEGGDSNSSNIERAGLARGVTGESSSKRHDARKVRAVKTTGGGGTTTGSMPGVKKEIQVDKGSTTGKMRGKIKGTNKKMSSSSSTLPSLGVSSSTTNTAASASSSYLTDENAAAANMLAAACGSLQVIRDEDLAAILPDQRDCAATTRSSGGGGVVVDASDATNAASDSDMELSHQAVDALIQRTTESSSESDGEMVNPPALYANSLLQQFEAQTQMLSTQLATTPCDKKLPPQNSNSNVKHSGEEKISLDASEKSRKRQRGRPKRTSAKTNNVPQKLQNMRGGNAAYGLSPNVSPDSGIQNSPDHVVSSPEPTIINTKRDEEKKEKSSKVSNKLSSSIDSLDRHFYGHSERTLYPPKRKPTRVSARKENMAKKKEKKEDNNKTSNNKSEKVSREKKHNHHSKESQAEKKQQQSESKGNVNNAEGKRSKSSFLFEICERVSKRLEMAGKNGQKQQQTSNQNGKVQKQQVNNKQINNVNNKSHRNVKRSSKTVVVETTKKMATLKTSKVMHSKHRHGVHKKRKFKILKPITYVCQDPKINAEIEKLVTDFMKLCITNNLKPNKENVPEILKTLKRVSKKRKTNEYERKKKKQNVNAQSVNKLENANNNEQRLPLKKRHYHVSTATTTTTTSENNNGKEIEESKENEEVAAKPKTAKNNEKSTQQNNNNEYHGAGDHVDEAIEACISRFNSSPEKAEGGAVKGPAPLTATTPKKRHRMMENNEMVDRKQLQQQQQQQPTTLQATPADVDEPSKTVRKNDVVNNGKKSTTTETTDASAAQMVTRKKNRLEDLTSNLVSKINPTFEVDNNNKKKKETEGNGRASVIKYPACKKTKPTELERLDDITSPKPTGIFMPTVEIDLGQMENVATSKKDADVSTDSRESRGTKSKSRAQQETEMTSTSTTETSKASKTATTTTLAESSKIVGSPVVPDNNDNNDNNKDDRIIAQDETTPPREAGKKKVRKRRAPNRTGFPTVKKKKKKTNANNNNNNSKSDNGCDNDSSIANGAIEEEDAGVGSVDKVGVAVGKAAAPKTTCDRVPVDGEELESFLNRTENCASYVSQDQPPNVVKRTKQQRPPSSSQQHHHAIDGNDLHNQRPVPTPSVVVDDDDVAAIYDSSSDCESLPQDERTEHDLDEFQLRPDVQSPVTSIDDLPTSDKRRCGDATDSSTLDEAPPTKRRGNSNSNALRRSNSTINNNNESDRDVPTLLGRGHRKRKSRGGGDEESSTLTSANDKSRRRLRARRGGLDGRKGSNERASSISTTVSTASSSTTTTTTTEERGKRGGGARAPRWKKRYLVAGLFSDYYKEDNESTRRKRQDPNPSSSSSSSNTTTSSSTSKANVYVPSEHPYGLLPPPYHCGRYLRQRRVHFQLPYDLHHHASTNNNRLFAAASPNPNNSTSTAPSSTTSSSSSSANLLGQQRHHSVPSWNYRKIRTNVYNVSRGERGNGGGGAYHSSSAAAAACEQQQCNCKEGAGCGEDCINRLVLSECPSANGGHRCDNQRIQKHEWSPGLEKFMTEEKGWGVRTKLPIKSNDFILEYVGEVVSDQEFKERMGCVYANDTHHYCLHLDAGLVIDGHRMGGDGRFVNHSCEPNCEMQKWSVNGQYRMALFALRDIEGGEELTYDYNFSLFDPAVGQECKCGSDMCRGVIGGKSQRVRPPNTDNKNGNVASATTHVVGRVGRPRKVIATSVRKTDAVSETGQRGGVDAKHNHNQQQLMQQQQQQNHNGVNNQNQQTQQQQQQKNHQYHLQHFQQHLQQQQQAVAIQVKPITEQQKVFVREHRCFLIRNIDKVRKVKDRAVGISFVNRPNTTSTTNATAATSSSSFDRHGGPSAFLNHLNALQKPRNMKTRRIAQAEDDPDLTRSIKLASILKDVYDAVVHFNDENGLQPSAPFQNLPAKRKHPEFHRQTSDPLDFSTIERRIANGTYKDYAEFDADVDKVLRTFTRFYGPSSEEAVTALRLRAVYGESKRLALRRLKAEGAEPASAREGDDAERSKVEGGGATTAATVAKKAKRNEEEEDIIRCICGMYHDEGLMIQCERCLVWQHCECVRADATAPSYHCEKCSPRPVDHEIPMEEFTEHGHRYYLTLMRGDLQLRQGDTVYVLRDIPIPGTDQKHTYKTIGDKPDYNDLDIFRIERLWKDSKTGQRLAYGHHYLRPHETYHEPTRKFFPNEVMRVPLYEAVPVELIISQCWVLDLNTYCKGRPVGADERHVYICEYRVDKSARLFYKVSHKARYTICTKSYVFERFPERLRASRTYTPHELDVAGGGAGGAAGGVAKNGNNDGNGDDKAKIKGAESHRNAGGGGGGGVRNGKREESNGGSSSSRGTAKSKVVEREVVAVQTRRRNSNEQKSRLNKILLNLLGKMPTKQILDVSYLLEGGRRRKNKLMKTNGSNNNNNINQ